MLLFIQYGSQGSRGYSPPIERVTVEISQPAIREDCINLTQSDKNCTLNSLGSRLYAVRLIAANSIGRTINETMFHCKWTHHLKSNVLYIIIVLLKFPFVVDAIHVNYSYLASKKSPKITVSLNPLCVEPLNTFFVGALFGIRKGEDCIFMQSEEVYFTSRILHIELDTSRVSIPNNTLDYQYCARVALNTHFPEGKILFTDVFIVIVVYSICLVSRCKTSGKEENISIVSRCKTSGKEENISNASRCQTSGKEDNLSIAFVSVATLIITLLIAVPVGALIGRFLTCKRQCNSSGKTKSSQPDHIYDTPYQVEVAGAIQLNRNAAYGEMKKQKRKKP